MRATISLGVRPDEHAELKARARAAEIPVSTWIVRCVRAALSGRPELTTPETAALAESNAEVARLAVALRTLARRLPEGAVEGAVTREVLEEIERVATAHAERTRAVLLASLDRWPLVP